MKNVVAAGNDGERLVAGIAAREGFAALVRCQLRRAAEQHTICPGALAALAGSDNDQVPFELGEASKHRRDQPPWWCRPMPRGNERKVALTAPMASACDCVELKRSGSA